MFSHCCFCRHEPHEINYIGTRGIRSLLLDVAQAQKEKQATSLS